MIVFKKGGDVKRYQETCMGGKKDGRQAEGCCSLVSLRAVIPSGGGLGTWVRTGDGPGSAFTLAEGKEIFEVGT